MFNALMTVNNYPVVYVISTYVGV